VGNATARPLAGVLVELDRLGQKRPSLQEACAALAAVLRAMFSEPAREEPLQMSSEAARGKLAEGTPLLRDVRPALDAPGLRRRWQAIAAALRQPGADALADAVRRGVLDPVALLHEVLAGRPEAVAPSGEALGLDGALAGTVLRFAALPALERLTQDLGELRQGGDWDRGYCPTCGSWPLLGESRGLQQERFLRCGWCASAWPFARLQCPYCGNRDHQTLGYLHVEGEEDRYRAGSCELCHGYVKWVSTLFPLATGQLLIADVATLHLDLAGAERGYFVV
jgi:FdhE protein